MSEVHSLRLVCTRRGTHKEKLLYVWRIRGGVDTLTAATFVPVTGSWWEPSRCTRVVPRSGKVCGLAPRIGAETVEFTRAIEDAIQKLKAGAWSVTVDVSELNL